MGGQTQRLQFSDLQIQELQTRDLQISPQLCLQLFHGAEAADVFQAVHPGNGAFDPEDPWEELPGGEGYADIVYLPKRESDWPALVIELKWNEKAEGAIAQIMNKKYPESLQGFGGEIILVGISYQKAAPGGEKKHTCRIVKL